jgi:hypothetical protein
MPRRELKSGRQVADWLVELGASLKAPGNLTLIGSAALPWHAHDRGITTESPEASMDVAPVTDSDEVAMRCYEALIGSEFERTHGWHVNLMPESVLAEFPAGWAQRATRRQVGNAPKLKRNEPRDRAHAEWAGRVGWLG